MQDLNTYGHWAICRPAGDDVVLREPPSHLLFVVLGLGPVGLIWVGLGWVWVDEMDPWTTLNRSSEASVSAWSRHCCLDDGSDELTGSDVTRDCSMLLYICVGV